MLFRQVKTIFLHGKSEMDELTGVFIIIKPIYRIFGDLEFVTVLGGAESKNRIRFCPSGQD